MPKVSRRTDREPLFSRHLVLVLALLVGWLISEFMILVIVGPDNENVKDFWSLTLTSFGTWIGAGAAYFFGRENLKTATDSMLQLRGVSPEEKLQQTTLLDIPPRLIPEQFEMETATISKVREYFDKDPDRYFAVVVDQGSRVVRNVLHEEGVMRYILEEGEKALTAKKDKAALDKELEGAGSLAKVISFIDGQVEALKKQGNANAAGAWQGLSNCAVILKGTESAKTARDNMEQKHLLLTVVVDNKGKPVGYITNSDLERVMLSA